MMYTIEHLVATFFAGLILGVISTIFFTRKELTIEMNLALLIITIWLSMHVYGFFFAVPVDWVFNVVGFGAVGTFVGVNVREIGGLRDLVSLIRKK